MDRRLNTDDRAVAAQRLRLLLWHAISRGQLPGGLKHEAWRLYGGKIPEETKRTKRLLRRLSALPWRQYELQRELMAERLGYCASTLDWLTNHEEDRRHDPERRAKCDATFGDPPVARPEEADAEIEVVAVQSGGHDVARPLEGTPYLRAGHNRPPALR